MKFQFDFNIGINKIKNENKIKIENDIKKIKNPNLDYTQKLLKILKEEKTEKIFIKKKEKNNEEKKINLNYEYEKQDKETIIENEKLIDEKNKEKNELELNNNSNRSFSTDDESNYNPDINLPKNHMNFFVLNLNNIRQSHENYIEKKIDNIKEINLNQFEKRIKVLKEDESTTIHIKNEKIPIYDIIEDYEKEIIEKISKITDNTLNDYEKREKVLQEQDESTRIKLYNNINNNKDLSKSNLSNSNISLNSTMNKTISSISKRIQDSQNISLDNTSFITNNSINKNNDSIDLNEFYLNKSLIYFKSKIEKEEKQNKIKKFNVLRANFCMKNNLYDIPINIENKHALVPEIYLIKENYFSFLYPDELKTYYICESGFILNHSITNMKIEEINKYKEKCDESTGLYFCGEKDNNIKKICSINNFICKNCMKINKSIYNIKDNYLININGRIAKININHYHCFGHFLINGQIENCTNKFTCKACKILEELRQYYM